MLFINSTLKRNLIANYLGTGWVALMGLAFIPIYIQYLGIEAWGLMAFMSMLQAWFFLLGMGMTPAIRREMARYTGGKNSVQSIRNLLRTLEATYVVIAALIVATVFAASHWIASHWLLRTHLRGEDIVTALHIIGVVLACRLAEQSYRGVLQGLQHQVWLNAMDAMLATLRWAGAAVVVAMSSNIHAFFVWQGMVSLISVVVLSIEAHRVLPPAPEGARFDSQLLWSIRRFAGGMAVVTFMSLLLTQVDKLLLSKLLPLEQYGVYMLAASVAGGLAFLVMPATLAVSPRLAQFVARGDEANVADLFHKAGQWVAALVVPSAITISVFSREFLWLWTGNASLAEQAAPLLSLLALGTMLNAFMHVPHHTQFAYGWTGLAVRTNMIAVAILVPAIFVVVPKYGAIAAAWLWCMLNAGYVLITPHFLHRKFLKGEKGAWYIHAVFKPLAISLLLLSITKLLLSPYLESRVVTAVCLVLNAMFCMAVTIFNMPRLRPVLGHILKDKLAWKRLLLAIRRILHILNRFRTLHRG